MRHAKTLTLLLFSAALGCGPSPEDCSRADERIAQCALPPKPKAPSLAYSDNCAQSSIEQCKAACIADASCQDLQTLTFDYAGCPEGEGAFGACLKACLPPDACFTPLVLSFDGGPVGFARSARAFDFGIGMSVVTDWPSARTPWLALDRNGDGVIGDGSELFGSASPLAGGGRAANGFIALAELDSDHDGRITPADEAWSRLVLWADADGDRVSSAGELRPLDAYGVVAIDLGYTRVPRCDTRGNCEVERASFRFRASASDEREGAVIDVHLRFQSD